MPPRRPLNILLATIEYPPDPFSAGIGSYTKALADALVDRGHKVHVVTRGETADRIEKEGALTIHRIAPARPELPDEFGALQMMSLGVKGLFSELHYRRKIAATLHELVQEQSIDLIESADHVAETILYTPAKHKHVPFVVRLHTPLAVGELFDKNIAEPLRQGVRLYEKQLLKKATHLTAPSQKGAYIMCKEMGIDVGSVTVFPNPPTMPFEDAPLTPTESNMVLYVGRLTRWKGVHLLARAIAAVSRECPQASFVFVGKDLPSSEGGGSTKEYLLQLVPSDLHDKLSFTGALPHDDVKPYLRRAAVAVIPSLFDSFGYTCLEAMSFGKAIVASDQGGLSDLLDRGRCGLLFTPPDVETLSSHIVRLLKNKALRLHYGTLAKERLLSTYSLESVMKQTENFYYRAITDLNPAFFDV